MDERPKKFAVIVDGEVAFAISPAPNAPQYEPTCAAFMSDPKIVEVPQDHPDFEVIGPDWIYVDGEFKNAYAYNPNVKPPEGF